MGLGFVYREQGDDDKVYYSISNTATSGKKPKDDVWKIIKGIGGILATLVMLGGIVWASAMLFASTASDDDLGKLKDRIELIEKNDIKQTLILTHIRESVDKFEGKLDKALKK